VSPLPTENDAKNRPTKACLYGQDATFRRAGIQALTGLFDKM